MCEQGAHRVQRVTLHRLDHLNVGSGGHGDRAMAQDPLDRRRLHAHREKQCGARMPKIMDAQLRHVGLLAHVVEHAVRVARFDEAAMRRREDQAGLTPLRAGGKPFFELSFAVALKMFTNGAGIGSTATDASVFTGSNRVGRRLGEAPVGPLVGPDRGRRRPRRVRAPRRGAVPSPAPPPTTRRADAVRRS